MITDVQIQRVDDDEVILTLAKAKKQLRLEDDFTDEDDLIQAYIDAAVEHAENYIACHIYEKTMTIKMSAFQNSVIFEAYPFIDITSVKYYVDDVETTMPSTNYYVTSQNIKQSVLTFKTLPAQTDERFDAVEIIIKVGFSKTVIPKPIIQAIKLMISDMYERREDRPETITTAAQSLMRAYRKYT